MKLITIYEERPVFWDVMLSDYRNRDKKQTALAEITSALNADSEDELTKAKKKEMKSGSEGSDTATYTTWPYFTVLQFVIPAVRARITTANIQPKFFSVTLSTLSSTSLLQCMPRRFGISLLAPFTWYNGAICAFRAHRPSAWMYRCSLLDIRKLWREQTARPTLSDLVGSKNIGFRRTRNLLATITSGGKDSSPDYNAWYRAERPNTPPSDTRPLQPTETNQQDNNDVDEPGTSAVHLFSVRKQKRKTQSVGISDSDLDEAIKKAKTFLDKPSDSYTVFGEYVAMELRYMRSNFNRRCLMSLIRRNIADVVDEDDNMHMSASKLSASSGYVDNSVPQGDYYVTTCAKLFTSFNPLSHPTRSHRFGTISVNFAFCCYKHDKCRRRCELSCRDCTNHHYSPRVGAMTLDITTPHLADTVCVASDSQQLPGNSQLEIVPLTESSSGSGKGDTAHASNAVACCTLCLVVARQRLKHSFGTFIKWRHAHLPRERCVGRGSPSTIEASSACRIRASFSIEEMNSIVRKTKLKKAPGMDGLMGEMLLRSYPRIREEMLTLFNDCLKTGTFPIEWKKGGGGNPRKEKSYMPITLSSVMRKTLECLIKRRLMEYLNVVQGIHSNQYGSMKGKSMEMAVMDMVDQVITYDQTYVLAVFLDI
ncbi:hypothetical protein PR048_014545 [Dryococelus australis]|uniref:MADF domain-containing protein n=1 Tax=Dryococelus australis TaxID=614101 RepID=A0ABQ9HEI5_9NEOP|nr:hypothetical protein PR048_014545 [Dryococelus australis]